MSILNPNNLDFTDFMSFSGMTTVAGRVTSLLRRDTTSEYSLFPLASVEVNNGKAYASIVSDLSVKDSTYVLLSLDTFVTATGSVTLTQKSFAHLTTVPSDLDSVWKVKMEINTDNTSTGRISRVQIRSFKSLADYLSVNKAGDVLITISK